MANTVRPSISLQILELVSSSKVPTREVRQRDGETVLRPDYAVLQQEQLDRMIEKSDALVDRVDDVFAGDNYLKQLLPGAWAAVSGTMALGVENLARWPLVLAYQVLK